MELKYFYKESLGTNINIGSYNAIRDKAVTISRLIQLHLTIGDDYYDDRSSQATGEHNIFHCDEDTLIRSQEHDSSNLLYNQLDYDVDVPIYERTANEPSYIAMLRAKELGLINFSDYSGSGHLTIAPVTRTIYRLPQQTIYNTADAEVTVNKEDAVIFMNDGDSYTFIGKDATEEHPHPESKIFVVIDGIEVFTTPSSLSNGTFTWSKTEFEGATLWQDKLWFRIDQATPTGPDWTKMPEYDIAYQFDSYPVNEGKTINGLWAGWGEATLVREYPDANYLQHPAIIVSDYQIMWKTEATVKGANGAVDASYRPEYLYIANNISLSDEGKEGEHVDLVVYKGKRGAKICSIPYGSYAKIKFNDGVDLEWVETVDCIG